VSEFVFAQQSLQPKLSYRRYASVLYAVQYNAAFKRAQNGVSDGSRTDNGSEFRSDGPETAKHLWPYLVKGQMHFSGSGILICGLASKTM